MAINESVRLLSDYLMIDDEMKMVELMNRWMERYEEMDVGIEVSGMKMIVIDEAMDEVEWLYV